MLSKVAAGFPSPADSEITHELSFDELLIQHPASSFFVRTIGNSLIEAGIFEGDILVVDKQLQAKNGQLVIAAVNGELTAKYLAQTSSGAPELRPANKTLKPITITAETECEVWGVVTGVVRQLLKPTA
jgi:DNA polymerase V